MGRSLLSPFGALLADIREEPKLAGPAPRPAPSAPAERPDREPDLRIETRVVSRPQRLRPGLGRVLWPVSLLLHAVLVVLLVVVPVLRSEAPAPVRATHAFFVAPASLTVPLAPPPPPAAAPAARRSAARPSVRSAAPAPSRFTAPVEVPEPVVAAASAAAPAVPDDAAPRGEAGGAPGGLPGGAPGGVTGGIVGGVIGGVAPPAPVAPVAPVRVGGEIREPRKIRHVTPVYPDLAVAAHVHGSVILECLVSPQGQVTDVKLVRGIPLLNTSAMDAVKQWLYTPTLKDGVPVPVILTVTVRFDL
jgi:periplasmic protein TonB